MQQQFLDSLVPRNCLVKRNDKMIGEHQFGKNSSDNEFTAVVPYTATFIAEDRCKLSAIRCIFIKVEHAHSVQAPCGDNVIH